MSRKRVVSPCIMFTDQYSLESTDVWFQKLAVPDRYLVG